MTFTSVCQTRSRRVTKSGIVFLPSADITAFRACQPVIFLLFCIPEGYRDAGIHDGKCVEKSGKPGDALLIFRVVQTAGKANRYILPGFFTAGSAFSLLSINQPAFGHGKSIPVFVGCYSRKMPF
jgi:hypothetical protein